MEKVHVKFFVSEGIVFCVGMALQVWFKEASGWLWITLAGAMGLMAWVWFWPSKKYSSRIERVQGAAKKKAIWAFVILGAVLVGALVGMTLALMLLPLLQALAKFYAAIGSHAL